MDLQACGSCPCLVLMGFGFSTVSGILAPSVAATLCVDIPLVTVF